MYSVTHKFRSTFFFTFCLLILEKNADKSNIKWKIQQKKKKDESKKVTNQEKVSLFPKINIGSDSKTYVG